MNGLILAVAGVVSCRSVCRQRQPRSFSGFYRLCGGGGAGSLGDPVAGAAEVRSDHS